MSMSLNRVQLIGNLGADPESRSFNNGGQVVNLRVACSESWKTRDGEKKERTEWVSVAIFVEHTGNFVKNNCRKGSKVFVEGKLQTRKWQDQSGNDRYTTEVVVQPYGGQVMLLDKPAPRDGGGGGYAGNDDFGSGGYGGGQSSGTRPQPAAFDTDLDDDVPF